MTIAHNTANSNGSNAVLLRPQEVAERLAVPVSWIREKTRGRARVRDADPFPVVKLGKYCRFRWSDVEAWLERQSR
jgi:predicted DNA-binding transcriptional regulator AlpA